MTESHVFDAIDPDLASCIVARRDLFRSSALKLGALASAPMMLATVSSEAFGQSLPRQIVDILNYALTLEYLESSFLPCRSGSSRSHSVARARGFPHNW